MPNRDAIERKDQRVELFGKAMYGSQWVVLSEDEVRYIGDIRDVATVPGRKLEAGLCRPLSGTWSNYDLPLFVHFGAPAEHEAAQRAWKRSLTRKDQVACVQKILRLA